MNYTLSLQTTITFKKIIIPPEIILDPILFCQKLSLKNEIKNIADWDKPALEEASHAHKQDLLESENLKCD